VAGIAGMAHAADMIYKNFDEEIARVRGLKNLFLEELVRMDGQQGENALFVNGRTGEDSAPHIISLTVPGVRAEVLLHALEDKGIYVSSGSACSTNRPHPSQTLQAIGLPRAYWDNTIRLSLSALNTEEDIRDTIAALGELVPFLRRYTRH
jgi:cysteine desulfurase